MSDGGRVQFKPSDGPGFICWLGNEGAKPTGGYGGWDIVERPRRLSLTQWNGRPPVSMDIALVFDGFTDDKSVEGDCLDLERMAFHDADKFEPPPTITITGDAVPHSNLEWVITNITWGNVIRRSSDGRRTRQEATVSVVRYVDADKVQMSAAQRARDHKTPKPPKWKPKKTRLRDIQPN